MAHPPDGDYRRRARSGEHWLSSSNGGDLRQNPIAWVGIVDPNDDHEIQTIVMKLTRRSVFGATCLCASCLLPGSLLATAPMVKRQAPGFYRLLIGDFEVTVLSDGTICCRS